jgi:hypothetical protein
MNNDRTGVVLYKNSEEEAAERDLLGHLQNCPIPADQLLENLGLFLTSKNLSRILFMHHIYQQIQSVPGVVIDLGTRWGQNSALFSTLRGIYDPFHRHRKIIGFDTFAGFPSVAPEDGKGDLMSVGNITVTPDYESFLARLMETHERLSPLSHLKKFELVKGDASITVPQYLKDNPETIVALAYFDFDLYEPTKVCLEALHPRLVKGSVVGFDELNDHGAPGETLALMETFGLANISLRRFPYASRSTYFVVE